MIIYSDRCLNCTDGKRLKQIKNFARTNNIELGGVRVDRSEKAREMAEAIIDGLDVKIPFILHGNKVINLYGNLEELLQ